MNIHFSEEKNKTEILFTKKEETLSILNEIHLEGRASFLIDKNVKNLFKSELQFTASTENNIMSVEPGEEAKSWEELKNILSFLTQRKQERSSPLIVIGGGSACDIGAFAASIYRRGIPLILIPTTLLAMVDAALGGKTAINYKENGRLYKNSIGSFYPASKIYCSPFWLETLHERERVSGVGELLKTLWLKGIDPPLKEIKEWIYSTNLERSAEIIKTKLWQFIQKSMEIKANIVEKDPKDKNGIREALNYGHSLAHALESIAKGEISHGEAVIWGMWIETDFFSPDGAFSSYLFKKIQELDLKLPSSFQNINSDDIEQCLKYDKKMKNQEISIQALTDLGKIEKKMLCIKKFSSFSADKLNSLN